ncbi:U6 snRNA phosphodiesterase isoform X2 [Salvia splendens]|uniref:U6 snRNA phosphodiesterase isoform X2 n=1 Tax=Salvia splendens TaxID=180675 RepID=UPI001C26EB64|nr:U6 snRNA phosphodiesterase isoform X2 [Salvia splendens]
MDALRASYGDTSSDSDSESCPTRIPDRTPLPPPPLSLLQPPNSAGISDVLHTEHPNRVRNFPHVEGNYALHVYIPVYFPVSSRREILPFLERVAAAVNELHVVDVDIPLSNLIKDEQKLNQVVLGREFHVSLGRTVPIRVHQRDSLVAMLRQKLQSHKRYWIDFDKWEVFVNDDCTRTFLSLEVTGAGLAEKQIELVNGVYKLHNLPEFYQNPRPHISVAWAVGDKSSSLKSVIKAEMKRHFEVVSKKRIFTCKFGGISCKIGNKIYDICKVPEV